VALAKIEHVHAGDGFVCGLGVGELDPAVASMLISAILWVVKKKVRERWKKEKQ
jgi:hypothetical protein